MTVEVYLLKTDDTFHSPAEYDLERVDASVQLIHVACKLHVDGHLLETYINSNQTRGDHCRSLLIQSEGHFLTNQSTTTSLS